MNKEKTEKRKIIIRYSGTQIEYESLKPSRFGGNGGWEDRGRKYDLRGIYQLMKGKTFDLVFEETDRRKIGENLRKYIREQEKKEKRRELTEITKD